MPNQTSKTIWVPQNQELPRVGTQCPKCEIGIIQSSQFGGVWCRECHSTWKLSKYPPRDTRIAPLTKLDQILKRLNEIELKIDSLLPEPEETKTNSPDNIPVIEDQPLEEEHIDVKDLPF